MTNTSRSVEDAVLRAYVDRDQLEGEGSPATRILDAIMADARNLIETGNFEGIRGKGGIYDAEDLKYVLRTMRERYGSGYILRLAKPRGHRLSCTERRVAELERQGRFRSKNSTALAKVSNLVSYILMRRMQFASGGILASVIAIGGLLVAIDDNRQQKEEIQFLRRGHQEMVALAKKELEIMERQAGAEERGAAADEAALELERQALRDQMIAMVNRSDKAFKSVSGEDTEELSRRPGSSVSDPTNLIALVTSALALIVSVISGTVVFLKRSSKNDLSTEATPDRADQELSAPAGNFRERRTASPQPLVRAEASPQESRGNMEHISEVEEMSDICNVLRQLVDAIDGINQRPVAVDIPQKIEIEGLVDLSQRLEQLLRYQKERAGVVGGTQKLEIPELVRTAELLKQFLQQKHDAACCGHQRVEIVHLEEVVRLLRGVLSKGEGVTTAPFSPQSDAQLIADEGPHEIVQFEGKDKDLSVTFRSSLAAFFSDPGRMPGMTTAVPHSGLASLLQEHSITVHDLVFIYCLARAQGGGVNLGSIRSYMKEIGSYPDASIFACSENLERRNMVRSYSSDYHLTTKAKSILSENQDEFLVFGAMLGEFGGDRH